MRITTETGLVSARGGRLLPLLLLALMFAGTVTVPVHAQHPNIDRGFQADKG